MIYKLIIFRLFSPPTFSIVVGPPLLLPVYFHVEVVYYTLKKRKWKVCSFTNFTNNNFPKTDNKICILFSVTGSRMYAVLLLFLSSDVRLFTGWFLGKLSLVLLYPILGEPLVCLVHSDQPYPHEHRPGQA